MEVFTVWCEWNIGEQDRVWLSADAAWDYIKEQIEGYGEDFDECVAEHLCGVTQMEIMK